MIVFGSILYPVSEHSFKLKAARRLFLARTKRRNLFTKQREKTKKRFIKSGLFNQEEIEELKKHKKIALRTKTNVCLYFQRQLLCLTQTVCWNCVSKRYERLIHLFDQTTEKLESELNIVKIIRNLREMKIYLNNNLLDRQIKFHINHSHKNVINLDSSGISVKSSMLDSGS